MHTVWKSWGRVHEVFAKLWEGGYIIGVVKIFWEGYTFLVFYCIFINKFCPPPPVCIYDRETVSTSLKIYGFGISYWKCYNCIPSYWLIFVCIVNETTKIPISHSAPDQLNSDHSKCIKNFRAILSSRDSIRHRFDRFSNFRRSGRRHHRRR